MANFVRRTEAPATDNRYYYADNPFYHSGVGLPNCTCYAWGRFWEIKGGDKPSLSLRDAEVWYGNTGDGYTRGSTPKLGAVICWRRGDAATDDDGAGHVAIVEAINADGSIVTSESGWGASSLWWEKTRSKGDGNWGQSSNYTFQGFIYNPVDFGSGSEVDNSDPAKIWGYFVGKIGNEYGVAGLMGNLQAESGLHADRVQGDIPYSSYSKEYTEDVDSGAISEYDFVHNGPGGGGYGLAQWTFWSRKQALYDKWKSGGYSSIGSLELALDYLWHELQNSYPTVLATLKTATSVREASDVVLHDFENPANQSVAVEEARCALGQAWFDKYTGTGDSVPGHEWQPNPDKKNIPLWLLVSAVKRK